MITKILTYGFFAINALMFSSYALLALNISVEEAQTFGMTTTIYQTTAFLDGLMVIFSLGMAFAFFKKSEKLFIATAWGYFGLYLQAAVFTTAMSLELGDMNEAIPVYIYGLISLCFVACGPLFIRKELAAVTSQ